MVIFTTAQAGSPLYFSTGCSPVTVVKITWARTKCSQIANQKFALAFQYEILACNRCKNYLGSNKMLIDY